MSKRKAANGDGSIEWRKGIAWVRIALPRAPGEPLQRKRLPIVASDKMSEGQVRKAAVKLAADVRAGRVIIDAKPRSGGAAPSVSPVLTVRQLGEKWTSGELVTTYGNVNRLRTKAGAQIDAWCLKANAYEVKTRGPVGAGVRSSATAERHDRRRCEGHGGITGRAPLRDTGQAIQPPAPALRPSALSSARSRRPPSPPHT